MILSSRRLLNSKLTGQLASVARMSSFYDFSADKLDGKATSLSDYKGKVVLIINTATL